MVRLETTIGVNLVIFRGIFKMFQCSVSACLSLMQHSFWKTRFISIKVCRSDVIDFRKLMVSVRP